jgi:hypothetical protein
VSEVLNRKRALSLRMVKRLHDGLRIPYESLLAGVRWEVSAVMMPPAFSRYLGIHDAGAEPPDSGLKNLRVYGGTPEALPHEVLPPPGPRKHGCRRELAHWLAAELAVELAVELAGDTPTIVGIDHALSFPLRYSRSTNLRRTG